MNDANTSVETGELGPMSVDQATAHLAGLLADSPEATPAEPNSEKDTSEIDATDLELEDEHSEEEAEYEDEAELEADNLDEDEYIDPDEQEAELYTVKLDGEEHSITLDELKKGFQYHSKNTRNAQIIAEERKQLEAERASISQERNHLKQMLEAVSQNPDPEPNWVELAENDPLEYTRQKAMWDAKAAERAATEAERQRLAEVEQHEQMQKMQQFVESQKAILAERIPELVGESGAQYRADILTYMEGAGYSKGELSQLFDARAVELADKARKYDALMNKGKAKAKTVVNKPKVIKPGVSQSTKGKVTAGRKKAVDRARKTGSVDDAVAAMLA